ncbi:MAG TPA: aminopeptidase P family protein, partial [Bacteroidetes bacterium]|nr:aminopeptidase P family protein [Bacteroidota bacterium]
GKSRKEKFDEVRSIMKENDTSQYLISALDSLAWILNLRGSDIDYNPVFLSFGVLRNNDFLLFIEENKVKQDLKDILNIENIKLKPYAEIYTYLNTLDNKTKIYVNPDTCNYNLFTSISAEIVKGDDIVGNLKAIKNPVEIKNLKKAHIIDGVALTKFYIWLEKTLESRTVSEYEAAEKLAFFRSKNKEYISESFGAIVGYKSNGAIIHYSPDEKNCAQIKPEGMLLIDSGGQYLCGTTDITRTTHFGNPSKEEKTNFTLVLKGHIAVAMLKFPEGTNGYQIDTFARQYLWEYGLNFYHGTGHGVGFFLNVHEGPQGISSALAKRTKVLIKPGMLTSNEPGYYKDGHYGIRIENLILAIDDQETEYGKFFKHTTVTIFPLDTKLIDESILTKAEVQWINDYQNEVYEKLSPHLDNDEKKWLREKCGNI